MKQLINFSKLPVPKQYLYFAISFLWIFASVRIFMLAWENTLASKLPVMVFAMGSFVGAYFFTKLVFRKVTSKYINRLDEMQNHRPSIFAMLSPKSYLVILLMISMGVGIKFLPFIPANAQAIFFGSLGLSLFTSAMFFYRAGRLQGSIQQ